MRCTTPCRDGTRPRRSPDEVFPFVDLGAGRVAIGDSRSAPDLAAVDFRFCPGVGNQRVALTPPCTAESSTPNACSPTVARTRSDVGCGQVPDMSPSHVRLDGTEIRSPRACLYIDESKSPGWLYIGVLAVLDAQADQLQWHLDRSR